MILPTCESNQALLNEAKALFAHAYAAGLIKPKLIAPKSDPYCISRAESSRLSYKKRRDRNWALGLRHDGKPRQRRMFYRVTGESPEEVARLKLEAKRDYARKRSAAFIRAGLNCYGKPRGKIGRPRKGTK